MAVVEKAIPLEVVVDHNGDRIPAIVSVVSTVIASVGMGVTMLLQLKGGVSEAVTGIPSIGVDFGGVGGGIWGLDAGLFQVLYCVFGGECVAISLCVWISMYDEMLLLSSSSSSF